MRGGGPRRSSVSSSSTPRTRVCAAVRGPASYRQDGDQERATAFDLLAGLKALEESEPLPAVPAIVVTAAVGRWLRVDEPAQLRPFSLAELDDRGQERQRLSRSDVAGGKFSRVPPDIASVWKRRDLSLWLSKPLSLQFETTRRSFSTLHGVACRGGIIDRS